MGSQDVHSCGLGPWRPGFLQRFATSRWFMVVYGLLGTVQAMSFVYFIATLTTLEKRFQIPSQTTGILMTGNEMSQILLSLILAYRGGKGNRPLWIAWGVLFSSLSCFILAAPHWAYGPGGNALALTKEFLDYKLVNTSTKGSLKDSSPFTCSATRETTEDAECIVENLERSVVPLILIFFSQFVLGIGTSLYMSLGQSYLDDNTEKSRTPLLLGITMALRTVGPAFGFILGFACLNMYVEPSLTPVIERRDPRWIGAWWLGWVILGSAMTLFAILMATFPKELKIPKKPAPENADSRDKQFYQEIATAEKEENSLFQEYFQNEMTTRKNWSDSEKTGLKESNQAETKVPENIFGDFGAALKRVLTNPLLMANNLTAVFYILGVSGYINFYSKYTETQFHTSAAGASMAAGVTTVSSMVFGFVMSGYIISKFKPRTSYLLAWNIFIGIVYLLGEFTMMFLGCDDTTMQGNLTDVGLLNPDASCNADCACDFIRYSPVCYEEANQTFFSACHAGCSEMTREIGKLVYSNCSCLPDPVLAVRQGPCNVDCNTAFISFLVVQCTIQFIGCSGRITTVLINYRSVDPKDKSIAQGLALFLISLFAFIPGPILFGKIIDNTCQVWDDSCGKRGNCWLYDRDAFRIHLNATAAAFTFGAVILDIVVWYLGRKIKFYGEPPDEAC